MTALSQDLEEAKRDLKKSKDALARERQDFDEVSRELRQHRKERDQLMGRLERLEEVKRYASIFFTFGRLIDCLID